MRRMQRILHYLCLALAVLGPAPASAAGFAECLAGLRGAALAGGVDGGTFDRATRGLTPNPEVLSLAEAQPEFKIPIWDYLAGLVDEERVNDGRSMLARWGQAFAAAERRYGVDKAVIAAVWGVESDYGRGFGTRPIVQSLATLSCGGRRQGYFRSEFIAALKILQHGDIDPAQFNGSWAGAFGHTQFMPSTFLRDAVDLDGDGRKDLINSVQTRLAQPPLICAKAAGFPEAIGVLRSACQKVTLAPLGGAGRSQWPPGRRGESRGSMAGRLAAARRPGFSCPRAPRAPLFSSPIIS